jgi:hypothetical protein
MARIGSEYGAFYHVPEVVEALAVNNGYDYVIKSDHPVERYAGQKVYEVWKVLSRVGMVYYSALHDALDTYSIRYHIGGLMQESNMFIFKTPRDAHSFMIWARENLANRAFAIARCYTPGYTLSDDVACVHMSERPMAIERNIERIKEYWDETNHDVRGTYHISGVRRGTMLTDRLYVDKVVWEREAWYHAH